MAEKEKLFLINFDLGDMFHTHFQTKGLALCICGQRLYRNTSEIEPKLNQLWFCVV